MNASRTDAQEFVRRLDLLDLESPMADDEALETLREFGLDPAQVANQGRAVVGSFDRAHPAPAALAPGRGPTRWLLAAAVLVGVVALGAALWLSLGSEQSREPGPPPVAAPRPAHPIAAPTRFDLAEWQQPTRTPDELAAPGGTPPLNVPATDADGHLEVAVEAGGAPRPGAHVRVYLRGPRDPNTSGSQWRFAGGGTTSAAGKLTLAARAGSYLVAVRGEGLSATRREVVRPAGEALTRVAVHLEAGSALRGRTVERGSGVEVPLAQLALSRFSSSVGERIDCPPEETVFVTSDSRGAFEVPALEPGSYRLEARAPGYGRTSRLLVAPRSTGLTVELSPASMLEGRVVDAQGGEASAASVIVRYATPGGEEVLTTTAGPEGAFSAEVPPGRSTVTARLGAQAGALDTPVLVSRGTTVRGLLIRLGTAGGLEGIVSSKSTGAPVADAVVALTPTGGEGDLGQRSTAADGRFTLSPLAAGAYDVEVYAEGYSPLVRRGVMVAVGQRFPLRLELEQTGSVAGTVRDAAGRPIADAVVQAGRTWGGPFIWGSGGQVRSGPDGSYRLTGLETGRVRLSAGRSADLWLAREFAEVGAGAETRVDLTLQDSGTLTGRVTRVGGAPLDVEVVVRTIPQAAFPTGADVRAVSVGPDGRYQLSLPAGRYAVRAFRVDDDPFMSPSGPPTVVEPGKTVEQNLDLLDKQEVLLAGRVLEADGTPSPYASLFLVAPGAAGKPLGSFWAMPARADEVGRFEALKRPGAPDVLDVFARNDARVGASAAARKGTRDVVVRLALAGAISGRVEGVPAPDGVVVEVKPIDERLLPWLSNGPREFAGGSFDLAEVPATAVRISVWAAHDDRSASAEVSVPGAGVARVAIRLDSVGSVAGRVVGEGGQPLVSAVLVLDNDGEFLSGKGGVFEIAAVSAGRHRLRATAPGYQQLSTDFTVAAGEHVMLGTIALVRQP